MREKQRQREDKVYYLHLQLTRIFRLVWPRSTRGSITYRSSYLTRTHWWQVDCIRWKMDFQVESEAETIYAAIRECE